MMNSTHLASLLTLKRKTIALAVVGCFVNHYSFATGTIESVSNGAINVSTIGNTTTIANTPGAIINWHDLSILSNETLVFQQANAASVVLNRVTGGEMTQILGALRSNGQVYLINPAGIAIGQGAVIDVAGFVASTLNMKDSDFLEGKLRFNADTLNPGSIINNGKITTPNGGYVYLIAPSIENSGVITTPSGEAILAAGHSVELVDSSDPNQRVKVSATSEDINLSGLMTSSKGNIFQILNKGTISANTVEKDATGRIFFKSAGSIQTTSSSVVEAHGNSNLNGGQIISFADTAGYYQGKFDVSGRNGGFIETSGHYLDITGIDLHGYALSSNGHGATWLLDPYNITIGDDSQTETSVSTIGNPPYTYFGTQSTSYIRASTLSSQLNSGVSIIVDTTGAGTDAGDIFVNAAIQQTASSDNTLTLKADGKIVFDVDGLITNRDANNNTTFNGTLNIHLLSDQNNAGNGGISFLGGTNHGVGIDTNGATNIALNSGDLTLSGKSGNTKPTFINSNTVNINAKAGSVNVIGSEFADGAFSTIHSVGDMVIKADNGVNVSGSVGNGVGVGSFASIEAGNSSNASNLTIYSGGNINVTGGIAGSNGVTPNGQSSPNGADASIRGHGNTKLLFHRLASLNVTGGLGGDNDSGTIAGDSSLVIQGVNSATDGTLNNSNNPNVFIVGGDSTTNNSTSHHSNFAALVGGSSLTLNASNLTMSGGNYSSSNNALINDSAIIGLKDASGNVVINLTNSTSQLANGSLSMNTSNSGLASAGIGSFLGNADITIRAGDIVMNGNSAIGATGFRNGLASGTANNANIDILAKGHLIMATGNTFIGSNRGKANIDINAKNLLGTSDTGISLNSGAVIQDASGNGTIKLTGSALSTGSTGVSIIDATVGRNLGSVSGSNVIIKGGDTNTDGVIIRATGGIQLGGNSAVAGNHVTLTGNNAVVANVATPSIIAASENGAVVITNKAATQLANLTSGNSDAKGSAPVTLILSGGVASGAVDIKLNTKGNASLIADQLINKTGLVNIFNGAGNLNIAISKINLGSGASISAGSDINIATKNLVLKNASISSQTGDVNINSIPLALNLASDQATAQQIAQVFFKLSKDSVIDLTNSTISAAGDTNIAAANITLTGSQVLANDTVSVFSQNGITLTGGNGTGTRGGTNSQAAAIIEGNETLIVSGGQISINSGTSSAAIGATSANSIYLNFPTLASDGVVIDGVVGAITSPTNTSTGLFVAGAPAVLDQNLHVTYGGLGKDVTTFINNTINESSKSTNVFLPSDDKNKKTKSQKECGA